MYSPLPPVNHAPLVARPRPACQRQDVRNELELGGLVQCSCLVAPLKCVVVELLGYFPELGLLVLVLRCLFNLFNRSTTSKSVPFRKATQIPPLSGQGENVHGCCITATGALVLLIAQSLLDAVLDGGRLLVVAHDRDDTLVRRRAVEESALGGRQVGQHARVVEGRIGGGHVLNQR